jgi:hypothetical protein
MVANKTLSPSTCNGYLKAINSERMKYWRDKTPAEASPSMLREWIRSLDVTAKFALNLLIPQRSVFDATLNDELIAANAFERIALAKLPRETTKASDYAPDLVPEIRPGWTPQTGPQMRQRPVRQARLGPLSRVVSTWESRANRQAGKADLMRFTRAPAYGLS